MERPPLLNDLFRMVVKMIVGGILIIGLFSCGAGVIGAAGSSGQVEETTVPHLYGEETSENAILQVEIKGPILTHGTDNPDPFGLMGGVTYGYEVKEQLLTAAEDDAIKAVMLFVTTPGGSIVGSQAIHDGVLAVKAAGKPVVAYVDTISASGGVWSTAAADQIFADHGSLVGSVGVNFGNIMFYDDPVAIDGGLLAGGIETRGGIKTRFVGAGIGKDLGNPFRPMTDREFNKLQGLAEEFYVKFLDHVVKHRGMDRAALIEEHGAMVYGNDEALQYGYIDGTKTFQETLAYIADQIGVEGDDWKLVGPEEETAGPFDIFGVRRQQQPSAADIEAASRLHNAQVCNELKSGLVAMTPTAMVGLCGV